jgi:hypothetical protein
LEMTVSSALESKLALTPIKVLLMNKKPLYDLATDGTMKDALFLMSKHQIQSIPVYKQPIPFGGTKSYKVFISLLIVRESCLTVTSWPRRYFWTRRQLTNRLAMKSSSLSRASLWTNFFLISFFQTKVNSGGTLL